MSGFRRVATASGLLLALLGAGCSTDVTIGAVISESGAVAPYGTNVKRGIELAREEITARGALATGGQLIMTYRDDATIAERGRQVVEELIHQEGARVIIGAVSSTVTLAIAPICESNRVLLFSPSASAAAISEAGEYVYRNYPSDVREGTSMATFARDLGIERIAIVAVKNDFADGLAEVFVRQYESKFREVVGTLRFAEGASAEFGAIVEQLQQLKPEGIFIVSYQNDMAGLLKEFRSAGIDAAMLGSSAVTPYLIQLAGSAAENLVFPQSEFDLGTRDPAVRSFVDAYRAKYGEDPDVYAAHGYDALKILVQAINTAQSAHPDDIRLALNGIHEYAGASGLTTFDKNGDVIRHPKIMIIRQGRPIAYDDYVKVGGSLLAAD